MRQGLGLNLLWNTGLPPDSPWPLDQDGMPAAKMAWSVTRKLRRAYTGPLIRVKHSSTATETDIYPGSDGYLNESAVTSAGGGSGVLYITRVYDQVGSRDLVQTTNANMPRIWSSAVGFNTSRGRAAALFVFSSGGLNGEDFWSVDGTAESLSGEMCIATSLNCGNSGAEYLWTSTSGAYRLDIDATNELTWNSTGYDIQASTFNNEGMQVIALQRDGSDEVRIWQNAVDVTVTPQTLSADPDDDFNVGALNDDQNGYVGNWFEMFVFETTLSASQLGNLEMPIDPITLFPLDQLSMPTPVEAFSCYRKLRRSYGGSCLRVRRSSDDAEQDIGFNDASSYFAYRLDTGAISSFCGASNGYVVTWYDQSGNGRNRTQSTQARQPLIYLGGVGVSVMDSIYADPAMELDPTSSGQGFVQGSLRSMTADVVGMMRYQTQDTGTSRALWNFASPSADFQVVTEDTSTGDELGLDGSTYNLTESANLRTGGRQTVCIQYDDSAGTLDIYLDGADVTDNQGTSVSLTSPKTWNNVVIGTDLSFTAGSTSYYGLMQEWYVWENALTTAQIALMGQV